MTRRGQAALEFLSTYGFAFLIILVMIGALAYFGVLDPTRFLPERCSFSSELDCRDFSVTLSGTDVNVQMLVGNNVGDEIVISDITLTSDYCGTDTDCAEDATVCSPGTPWTIATGGQDTIQCETTGENFPGSGKVKIGVDVTYQATRGAFPHTVQGEIFANLG